MRELALEGREEGKQEAGTPWLPGHLQTLPRGRGQTSRAWPPPSPTPGHPSSHAHVPLPKAGWAQDPSLEPCSEGRPWPRSPGQQRETQCLQAEDGSPLQGFAPRGGSGSSAENQGPGTLVSGAADPT